LYLLNIPDAQELKYYNRRSIPLTEKNLAFSDSCERRHGTCLDLCFRKERGNHGCSALDKIKQTEHIFIDVIKKKLLWHNTQNQFEVNLTISSMTINEVITTLYKLALVCDNPIRTLARLSQPHL
jgi:hypothetical protein